jgi:hypothetical protein
MKRVTIDEVPGRINDAAEQLSSYFSAQGVLAWSLGGVQSCYKGPPPGADPRVVDAPHEQLAQALKSKDNVPTDLDHVVAAAVHHLGFCCLGGRIVRLSLPNGRVIRVTLE